jgi:prolyl-tRNA editing enzyme YbaK/EbsC (Cys-tRNA(Pro) deacylase)
MVADDEQVSSAGKTVVLDHGDTRIVVTVVPTTMHVDVE